MKGGETWKLVDGVGGVDDMLLIVSWMLRRSSSSREKKP